MSKNLVIVESPAKAKTIEKFLGDKFKVVSSYGHISDLPAKELGVDVAGDFSPNYIVNDDKKKVVRELRTLAKKAETIWLASDEDREGEAIAWHLAQQLDLNQQSTKRIVFHEITKDAIQNAIQHPRSINQHLVDAQQARRVLDRLVGYELSPILWRKVKGGLSAGRVQSVSVRIIVEREREIEAFTPKASYKIHAIFLTGLGKAIKASSAATYETAEEANAFLSQNIGAAFAVSNLEKKPASKSPTAPFTTSTLQQEASRKLGFSVSRTMSNAQRLYEAGHITYMRTDSVNLSKQALNEAREVITNSYGPDYAQTRVFKTKNKGAQEAHEAIRPTKLARMRVDAAPDEQRLYELIWKRTVASQMSDAKLERTVIQISNDKHDKKFTARGEVVTFEGFLKVYFEGKDEEEDAQEGLLPKVNQGDQLDAKTITATERFTRPRARYTEASLVKRLEELGIGRPSTYAPTITTIINRKYIEKGTVEGDERKYTQLVLMQNDIKKEILSERVGSEKGKLVPTDVGMLVNDFLVKNFPRVVDYNFTAEVEQSFDSIALGNEDWKSMMKSFYKDFHPVVEDVKENAQREIGERILGVDPKTGRQLSVRLGKFGAMAQIGTAEEEEKPLFASLHPDQQLTKITFEEALDLFKLPLHLGEFDSEAVEVNNGRYGPYVRHGKTFISLPKGKNPLTTTLEEAIEYIKEKRIADAPIATYEELPVTKGVGRFGPFIKWNGWFVNVSKKYDYDNLTDADIAQLIEDKKKKEAERVVHNWEDEGVRVEKARWGRHNIIKGKQKVELQKTIDVSEMTLTQAMSYLEKQKPKKKKRTKKK
ncbi:MAG: type I DNA topoisomerase [Flavobacteriaceae bacterium]|jgi:DNA topoisomerase-1|nr:type I DNA topoisomerase [Flavobacteriaceae bacterium]MDG2290559.1 type I DNA topoisomerase [Flavobacteriaceae bacterium]